MKHKINYVCIIFHAGQAKIRVHKKTNALYLSSLHFGYIHCGSVDAMESIESEMKEKHGGILLTQRLLGSSEHCS